MGRKRSRSDRLLLVGAQDDVISNNKRLQKKEKRPAGFPQQATDFQKEPVPTPESDEEEEEEEQDEAISGKEEEEEEDDEEDDDDDDDDMGEEEEEEAPMPKATAGDKRYQVPTHEEMDQLNTASSMFKNSLFSMQVAELLAEVSIDYGKLKTLEKLLHSLKSSLEGVDEATVTEVLPSMRLYGRVAPSLDFQAPTRVDLVGSYLPRTVAKPALGVDLAIQMPSACFHPKDFLNYRYADKRALYLSHLAQHLMQDPQFADLAVEGFCGDTDKPVLVLTANSKQSKTSKLASKFVIRLLPAVDPSVFPHAKLLPTRNNVRSEAKGAEAGDTPQHNNAVVEDMMLKEHVELTHRICSASTAVQECAIMLKVWLRQRRIATLLDGINGFVLTMFLCHLISQRKASSRMSSYQLFKLVLEFVVGADLCGAGVAMGPAGAATEQLPKFASRFAAVLLDPSDRLNLLARAGQSAIEALKQEASSTLEALRLPGARSFDAVFVSGGEGVLSQLVRYDEVVTLPPTSEEVDAGDIAEFGDIRARMHRIEELLRQALSDRVQLVRCLPAKTESRWPVNSEAPLQQLQFVGLLMHADNATRLVDKGPSSDDVANAKIFRDFWGQKAELRHFKDGTIVEAVVWDAEVKSSSPLQIPQLITSHILHRHLQYSPADLHFSGQALVPALELPPIAGGSAVKEAADQRIAAVQKCLNSFERLSSRIRCLKDLPLEVTSIQGTCPTLRHCAVFGPFQSPLAGGARGMADSDNSRCVGALTAVINLEASGKWPDDLAAIAHLKAAFYLQIAKQMRSDPDVEVKVSMDWLHVLSDGYIFELEIAYPRELDLMRSLGAVSQDHKALISTAKDLEIAQKWAPLHSSLVNGFQSKHAAYPVTVRLVKRWLHAHMLSDHFTEEMAELLVANLFAHPHPYQEPHNATCGLLRFFLLLTTFNWELSPLVVDVNNELTEVDHGLIMRSFEKQRESGSAPACFISTPMDREASLWTKEKPSPMIFSRMIHLAQQCLTQLSQPNKVSGAPGLCDWVCAKRIFKSATQAFDVLIKLDKTQIPNIREAALRSKGAKVKGKFALSKYKNIHSDSSSLLVGFNPVQKYVQVLEANFGTFAVFFFDQLGGNTIGVAWRPSAFLPQPFRVIDSHGKIAIELPNTKSKCQMIPNISSILEDFKNLGKGMVDSVECL